MAEPPEILEETWRFREPFVSVACLCPAQVTQDQMTAWRMLCLRAVRIMGAETHQPRLSVGELKGHVICFESSGRYAFCAKCYIARRLRDYRWICMRQCKKEERGMAGEGDYILEGNHLGRIEMQRWKESAIRPFKRCVGCGIGCWATSRMSGVCPEV